MQAGRLRSRVELKTLKYRQDENSGAMMESWQSAGAVWAGIEALSARDFIAASAAQSAISARAIIRYRADIKAGMRLIHNHATYHIEGALPDKHSGQDYLTLLLKTVSA